MIRKLSLWFFFHMAIAIIPVCAQTTITFTVDANAFIANGGVMANGVVSIAGNFAARGSSLADWTPGVGAMTALGANVWSTTITFSGNAVTTDSLEWKYVQGANWADGDEGNDWGPSGIPRSCGRGAPNNNRKLKIPASGNWLVSSAWAQCATLSVFNTPILATLTTTAASSITQTTASSGGTISSDGGAAVTARGVVWSSVVNPTIALTTKTVDGTGTGAFTSAIIGLTANTIYYARAYATNSVGTSYGNPITFTTLRIPSNDSTVITFQVDISDFLLAGGTINQIVSIAGSFKSRGGNLLNWTPQTGPMTNIGNNIWSRTVTFKGDTISTDSLEWKYVQGSNWPDGDEGNDWGPNGAPRSCTKGADNNRKILLPSSGTLLVSSKWAQCPQLLTDLKNSNLNSEMVIFPNPASDYLTVKFGKQDEAYSVRLISFEGKELINAKSQKPENEGIKLNVSSLPNGLYKLIAFGRNGMNQKTISILR